MQQITIKLTVLFDDPFWIGVYERCIDGKLEVCKITFGAEPKDYEVYMFLLQNWDQLHFSSPIEFDMRHMKNINPKRMQRTIKKQLKSEGIGTKSQQALKIQYEENKIAQKSTNRQQKEARKQRQFELRQQKRKEKHRGR